MCRALLSIPSLSLAAALLTGCPGNAGEPFVPMQTGQVSILNKSHEMHRLELYPLRPDLVIDCEVLLEQPQDVLRRDVFAFTDEPWRVELFSGQEVSADVDTWMLGGFFFDEFFFNEFSSAPVEGSWSMTSDRGCEAVLVQSAALPDLVVYWTTSPNALGIEIPDFKSFPLDESIPKEIPADPYTIVLDADYAQAEPSEVRPYREPVCEQALPNDCTPGERDAAAVLPAGARYTWRMVAPAQVSIALPDPVSGSARPPERCAMPGPESSIAWEELPSDTFDGKLLGVRPGEDGCHDVLLESTSPDAASSTWSFCAPRAFADAMEPRPGEDTRVTIQLVEQPGQFALERKALVSVVALNDIGVRLRETGFVFVRGTDVLRDLGLLNSPQRPVRRPVCAPELLACGQVAAPFDLDVGESLGGGLWRPGTTRADPAGSLYYLGHARLLPFYAPQCQPEAIPTGRVPAQRVNTQTFLDFSLVPIYLEAAHVRFNP